MTERLNNNYIYVVHTHTHTHIYIYIVHTHTHTHIYIYRESSLSHESENISHSVMSDSLWPHGLYSPPGSSVDGILQARILE